MYLIVYTQDIGGNDVVTGAESIDLDGLINLCSTEREECCFSILKQEGDKYRELNEDEFEEFQFRMSQIETKEVDFVLPAPEVGAQENSNREES